MKIAPIDIYDTSICHAMHDVYSFKSSLSQLRTTKKQKLVRKI